MATVTPAQLEWMRRNYATLTPEQRAIVDAASGRPPQDPNRSTAEVTFDGPAPSVEADLEAASMPIAPEPMAGPVRKRSRADWAVDASAGGSLYSPSENVDAMDIGMRPTLSATMQSANTLASPEAFDAAFRASGSHYPSAVAAFADGLIARGVDPGYARRAAAAAAEEHRAPSSSGVYAEEMASTEDSAALYPGYRNAPAGGGRRIPFGAMPDADPRTTRAERLAQSAQWAAGVDRMKEDYDRATGYTPVVASVPAEEGPYPGAGRPGYDRTYTPDEVLAQRADMASGGTSGRPITETVPGPRLVGGAAVRPPRPIYDEEEAAGYTERPFDTNTGKYKPSKKDRDMAERGLVPVLNEDGTVGYSVGYDVDPLQASMPGAAGRAGRRRDLERAGWGAVSVDGPMGPVQVYRPSPEAQKRYDAQAEDRSRSRIKRSAGISSAEAAGMTTDQLRSAARNKRDDDYNARNATWKAQAMLAGGQPTGGPGGTKAVTNAFLMMNDPSLSEEQQQSLRYMLPGGALAAQVDARQLDMAAGLARQAITGALAGTAQGPMAAAQAELAQLQAQAERDKLRAADEDVLGEKYAPTGWLGYDEFTIAEQQQMYDDLIAQGYKPAEAQRAVDRQAKKRRATQRQRWSDAGA